MRIRSVFIFLAFALSFALMHTVAFAEEPVGFVVAEENAVIMPETGGEVEVAEADETYEPPEPESLKPPEPVPQAAEALAINGFSVVKLGAASARIYLDPVEGATKYLIYRSEKVSGGYSLISKLKSAASVRDDGLTCGKTYYYKAVAYSDTGKGPFTEPAAVTATVDKLANLKAESVEAGRVRLSWDPLLGADKFMIYRAKQEYYNYSNAPKPLKYKLSATVYGERTEYIDKYAGQGETYYYKVSPYGGDYGSGATQPVSANAKVSAKIQAFLKAAREQEGKTYVLGGKGPSVFDCSGLIYYALNKSGYGIAYMTSYGWAQSSYRTVNTADAQAGDILCYDGHVGIYAGAGIMIDASTSLASVVERPVWGTVKFAKRVLS